MAALNEWKHTALLGFKMNGDKDVKSNYSVMQKSCNY